MQFMVRMKVELPGDMDPAKVKAINTAEADRAVELVKQGKLRRIWRIVGERANFSIWDAGDLDELHTNISSLPLHPWMSVTVTPIIEHPATAYYESKEGAFPKV